MPAAELAPLQTALWREQVARVEGSSTFFRGLWQGRSPPRTLADMPALPLCDKSMLRADQRAHPPLGSYLACAPEELRRLHRTSGTTGEAMNLALSAEDCEVTATVAGRAQTAAGLGPGHRVVHCLNYQLWMGGLTDHLGLDGPVVTVAHDWGGPISLGWAQRVFATDPRRLRGIVLTNTAVHQPEGSPAPTLIRSARLPGVLRRVTVDTTVFLRGAIEMSRPRLAPEVRHGFLAPYASAERREAIADFVEDIPLDGAHPSPSSA